MICDVASEWTIEEGLVDYVVMNLMNPYFDTGLNVTTTFLYCQELRTKNKQKMVVTVYQNRKEISEKIKLGKNDDEL